MRVDLGDPESYLKLAVGKAKNQRLVFTTEFPPSKKKSSVIGSTARWG